MMLGKKIHENLTNILEDTGFEMFHNYCDGRRHFDLGVMWTISKNSYPQEY